MYVLINLHWCLILRQKNQILSQERLFRDVFETMQVKSPRSKTASGTHKTETFPIPKVLYVRMSSKEAIFYGLSPTKDDIVDDLPANDEDSIEEEESEVTMMEIEIFRNEYMREKEEDRNRRLLLNHEVVNKGCSRKNKSPVWAFSLPF